jgi:hypothetical protein
MLLSSDLPSLVPLISLTTVVMTTDFLTLFPLRSHSRLVFLQALQDWTMIGWLPIPTSADQSLECSGEGVEITHFGFNLHELGFRLPLHVTAAGFRTGLKIEQLGNLMEREAQCLRILDEPQPPLRISVVQPVTGWESRHWTEQVQSLVIANRLDIDTHLFRELPDFQVCDHTITS